MRISSAIVIGGLLGLGLIAGGCETSKAPVVGDGQEVAAPVTGAEREVAAMDVDHTALIKRVQVLRDREFEKTPAFGATTGALEGTADNDAVKGDKRAILRGLFGHAGELGSTASKELAVYDGDNHRVVYRQGAADEAAMEVALVMAVVEALESERGSVQGPAKSWDEALAQTAARRGSGAFVASLYRAEDHEKAIEAAALAERPELAMRIEGMGRWLGDGKATSLEDYIDVASRSFALREGLGLTAALYRAGRWSAVEFAHAEGIGETGYVVRADRWLRGDGLGTWTISRELDETRRKTGLILDTEGRVGPAVIAIWLGQVIDAQAARTVYTGWMSDTYRLWTVGEDKAALFEWVSQWDTPHSAHQIAEVIGIALQRRFKDEAERHVRVTRDGVNVAVVVSEKATDGTVLENAAALLASSTVGYMPSDARPLEFVPTRLDEYVRAAFAATMEDDVWADPATGLSVELSALSAWDLQKTDEVGVRWFARHGDGALVQMTTELYDPFAPPFESDEYLARLGAAFGQSMGGAAIEDSERRDTDFGAALEFVVEGKVEGEPRRLRVWQWLRGDVLMTYSLQASPKRFEARESEAQAVVETMRVVNEAAVGTVEVEEDGDDGILEFRVED